MILAAGLGTRLRPLTNDRPKALVEISGRTLIELVLSRLRDFGISEVVINTHYFAEMLADYLRAHHNFGMDITISHEDVLLDTGGGLKHAQQFLADSDDPFLLHNVDVLSDIDFGEMIRFHSQHDALATLAVKDRKTSRYLLFDQNRQLCGRRAGKAGELEVARPAESFVARAFCGIHVLSPRIFAVMREEGIFPVIPEYLRLAAQNEKILGFPADEYYWRDLGRIEDVKQAIHDLQNGILRSN